MSYYEEWVEPCALFRHGTQPKGSKAMDDYATCPLCERDDIPVGYFSDHHLIPKSRGGRHGPTVPICADCHSTVHRFFDNKELEKELNTVESLQAHPVMVKHLAWQKKRPGYRRYKPVRRKR